MLSLPTAVKAQHASTCMVWYCPEFPSCALNLFCTSILSGDVSAVFKVVSEYQNDEWLRTSNLILCPYFKCQPVELDGFVRSHVYFIL